MYGDPELVADDGDVAQLSGGDAAVGEAGDELGAKRRAVVAGDVIQM